MGSLLLIAGILVLFSTSIAAQPNKSIAVSNIDTRGMSIDPVAMGNLLRIEIEKKKENSVNRDT